MCCMLKIYIMAKLLLLLFFIVVVFGDDKVNNFCDELVCDCFDVTDETSLSVRKYVDCSDKELKEIPKNMSIPYMATEIHFSNNDIEIIFNNTYFRSIYATLITLTYNKISKIEAMFFEFVPHLTELDLSHNRLKILPPNLFGGLEKLRRLDISYNSLKILPNRIFGSLYSLNDLILSDNPIGPFLLEKKTQIFKKTGLSLSNNVRLLELNNINLVEIPYDIVLKENNIKQLFVTDNPITVFPTISNKIEELDISGTLVKNVSFKNFPFDSSLQILIMERLLNFTMIEDYAFYNLDKINLISFTSCANLKHFNKLAFGEIGGSSHSIKPNLKVISLARCGLRHLDQYLLNIFEKLEYIRLDENPWHCDCHIEWFSNLKIAQYTKINTRCHSPETLKKMQLKNLLTSPCTEWSGSSGYYFGNVDYNGHIEKQSNISVIMLGLIMLLIILTGILIYLGPYSKERNTGFVGIGPNSPYSRVTIEPNSAEQ